jgi:thiosulfate/3-mercaptopyruvate sulfurtransferase
VYDDRGGAVASRLWWMLTDQGHKATQILDGGIGAWVEAGGTLTAELAQPSGGDRFVTSAWRGTATIDEVDATVGPVVDARAADRYQGHTEPIDPKRGHVPGAINLPYETNLTEGRFAESDRLRANLVGAGFDHQTIVHCGSGVTACHLIVAAELAGLPRPKLFVGSWSEWSSTDRSVATGPTP